jgi:uncharacterized membrane protein (GlpM family)
MVAGVAVQPDQAREIDWRGMLVRFAFGFAVSLAVGIIAKFAGDRVAGLFLAFPAILPASLTLIAENDGEASAKIDAAGAVLGGIALAAFGAASWLLLPRVNPVVAEVAAVVAWTIVAAGLYLAVRGRFPT